MRMHSRFLPLAIAAALACAGTAAAAEGNPLADTGWALIALGDKTVADAVKTTLTVNADGSIGGRGGCNLYGGAISFSGETAIALGDIFSTMMYCGDAAMAQERAYFDALEATAAYARDGETLTLLDSAGKALATFVASATKKANAPKGQEGQPDLNGTQWRATSLAGTPVAPEVLTTLIFRPDGSVGGNSGCNSYGGQASASPDGTIAFTQIVTTQIGCMGAAGAQEQALYQAFESAVSYRVDADTLTLSDADGTVLARFAVTSQ